jgi:radical SAM protein with 4Fe4S-binding SPASM domain
MKLVLPFTKGPLSMVHFVTLNCNARCSHCFIDFKNPETFKGNLTVEEINKMTKSVGKQLRNVNITGGEPFLRRDLWDIAQCYFNNTSIKTMYITTNGFFTKWIKEFIEKFIADGRSELLIFSISMDDYPDKHDANRKVKGLFDKAAETYNMIRSFDQPNILVNVNLTIIPANYEEILPFYHYLVDTVGIRSFTTTIVREEGVMKIPNDLKKGILTAYKALNEVIREDMVSGRIEGYRGGLVGQVLNAKNVVMHDIIEKTFPNNAFVTPCYAGDLFLVVEANGNVRPCEVLPKSIGNLRDYDYDLMRLWKDKTASDTRKWISDTKCRCTYECAATINVLFNAKHAPSLLKNVVSITVGTAFHKYRSRKNT